MDNKSFSLQFNPLTNVKCVKDYEEEISNLKAEIFELKTQLTHTNIPKVLYESKQEMENLQLQNQEIKNAYENLNRTYQSLLQEKSLLENKYNKDMTDSAEKHAFIEDENKRILLRLEKLNREVQDTINIKNEVIRLREMIQNQEKHNEQQKYIYEREITEVKSTFDNFKREAENEINKRNYELENQTKKYEQLNQKEKTNSFVINDLKATINSNMKEKALNEDLLNRNKLLENKDKENMEVIEKVKKDIKLYSNGMDKFRCLILKKMNEVTSGLHGVSENFVKLRSFCFISEENYRFFIKLNHSYSNINEIICFFRDKHMESHKRIEVLKKEASDAVFFASNAKSNVEKKAIGFLHEFRDQFNVAKDELLVCKKYLEKKANENKALKIENGRLLNELKARYKQVETGKIVYDNPLSRADVMRI